MLKNSAFVVIKPHAVADKVKKRVQKTFQAKGIEIQKEGGIEAAEIDKRMLVDRHYYSIAFMTTLKKPTERNIPMDKFKEFFGVDWDEAVEAGKVFNAKDACEKLQIHADAMNEMWGLRLIALRRRSDLCF